MTRMTITDTFSHWSVIFHVMQNLDRFAASALRNFCYVALTKYQHAGGHYDRFDFNIGTCPQ
jgi:hypothetical protein